MPDSSDTKKIVENLNAGWYNVVANALHLDPQHFQLAQGTLGLQTADSSGLWRMADAVPPSAVVHYYDASGLSQRSSAYGELLEALLPETGSGLRDALGDMYAAWVTYANANGWDAHTFDDWAQKHLPPTKAVRAKAVYLETANSPLLKAIAAYNDAANQETFVGPDDKSFSLYRYSPSRDDAVSAINTGSSATIDYDSETADTSLKQTTVEGSASGFYDIFSGAAEGSLDKLNTEAAAHRITIKGTIHKVATLAVVPGAWFTSAEFTRAYNAKGNFDVWDAQSNAGDWNSFFEQPNGSLARRVSQLVLVSDYDITVTSHASYTQEDYQQIKSDASFGVWPFFSGHASATHTTDYTLNKDSSLSARFRLAQGLIQIWGVSVQEAPD